jgi:predicted RND superfamily exporter protein
VSVLISIIWTIGIMCLFRIPLSIISDIIPVTLVAVGSAYAIHVVSKFNEDNVAGPDRLDRARKALRGVVVPVFLAAATTMAGFISFIFGAYLTMIGEFGIFSALGVLLAFLISVTFVPAVLTSLGAKTIRFNNPMPEKKNCFMEKFGIGVVKYRKLILIAAAVLLAVSALGIPMIKRQVEIVDYFKPGTPTRLGEQAMERYFGGSTPLQILVRGDIADPAALRAMKKMEDFLATLPNVHHPQSVADLIEEMDDLMGEGKTIPDSRAKVANLWFLLEGEDIMSQLVNGDKTEAVIQATLGKNSVHEVRGMIGKIDDYIRKNNTDALSFSQTGMHYIHLKLDRAIVFNQAQSMVLAIVLIFIMVALMLRSFFGGLIGLLPITFSLVMVFGIMGYTRIPLDIATMLVGGIAIGTGIDYAIHFSSRFRHELRTGKDPRAAVIATMGTTGQAILINVLTVIMGFLVLALAQLVPLQRFGLLIAITTATRGHAHDRHRDENQRR